MAHVVNAGRRFLANNWWVFIALFVLATWVFLAFSNAEIDNWILIGVIITAVSLGFSVVVIFFRRRGSSRLSRALLGVDKLTERELAKYADTYKEEAHSFLHDISREKDASGVAIPVKGEYIYFSNQAVKRFKKAYETGLNSKELLAELVEFDTREEVKQMIAKLKEFDELPPREKREED